MKVRLWTTKLWSSVEKQVVFTRDPSVVKSELKRNMLIFNTWRERFQICPVDKRLSIEIDYPCHTLEIVVKRLN